MSTEILISILGVLIATVMVIITSYKGYSVVLCFPIACMIIAATSGLNLVDSVLGLFASSFGNMLASVMFIYLCSCMFARILTESGAAFSIAEWISKLVSPKYAPSIITMIAAVLTFGGMSVGCYLIVFPIALILCQKGGYSKNIILGCILSGSWTFAACMPGSPSSHNAIAMSILGTPSTAGGIPGILGGLMICIGNCAYVEWQARRWAKRGRVFQAFDEVPDQTEETKAGYPPVWRAFIPILATILVFNLGGTALPTAMFFGSIIATLCEFRKFNLVQWVKIWQTGLLDGIHPMVNIGVKAGLGGVVAATPCYLALVNNIATIGINPYALAFFGCAILAGFLGSATSAEGIALPQLLPIFEGFVANGANMGYLHRLAVMGAITLDSLPHNGSILACCAMFKTTHKESYWPVFVTCTVIPLVAGVLTIPLCAIF